MPASHRVIRTRFATDTSYAGCRPLTRENALMLATLPIGRGQSSPMYAPVPVGDEHHRNSGSGRVHRARETPSSERKCRRLPLPHLLEESLESPSPTKVPLTSSGQDHFTYALNQITYSPNHFPSKPSGRELMLCTISGFPCTICENSRSRHPLLISTASPLHALSLPRTSEVLQFRRLREQLRRETVEVQQFLESEVDDSVP